VRISATSFSVATWLKGWLRQFNTTRDNPLGDFALMLSDSLSSLLQDESGSCHPFLASPGLFVRRPAAAPIKSVLVRIAGLFKEAWCARNTRANREPFAASCSAPPSGAAQTTAFRPGDCKVEPIRFHLPTVGETNGRRGRQGWVVPHGYGIAMTSLWEIGPDLFRARPPDSRVADWRSRRACATACTQRTRYWRPASPVILLWTFLIKRFGGAIRNF